MGLFGRSGSRRAKVGEPGAPGSSSSAAGDAGSGGSSSDADAYSAGMDSAMRLLRSSSAEELASEEEAVRRAAHAVANAFVHGQRQGADDDERRNS